MSLKYHGLLAQTASFNAKHETEILDTGPAPRSRRLFIARNMMTLSRLLDPD